MGFAWDGLRMYGAYGKLDEKTRSSYHKNQEIVNNSSRFNTNDCQ